LVWPYYAWATILDNEPVVSLEATEPIATELDQVAGTFTVTREADDISSDLSVTYSVSGTAAEGVDYQVLTGTVTIPAGQTSAPIDVTPIADGVLENDETVTVTLVDEDWYNLADSWWSVPSATVTILDDKPMVSIQATDPDAAEDGIDPGQFTVSRTGGTTDDLIVYYTVPTAGGSEVISDGDYVGLPGYLVIPAGSASATIDLVPINDILAEAAEEVQIVLTNDETYRASSTEGSAVVTIADDDPQVWIEATDATAAEEGLDPGAFTITRSAGDWSQPLTVLYNIGGSAGAGEDYSGMSVLGVGSVTIQAGNPSATISVTPIDDTLGDPDETIEVTLQPNTTYAITGATAVVTIFDDEPIVSIEATDATAGEDGPDQAEFAVTRTGSTTPDLVVYYTVSGTADYDVEPDYSGLPNFDGMGSGWVTIAAGFASEVITVMPIDDASVEGDETVTLTLSTDAGYPVGTPGSASVTITDNDVLAEVTDLTATPVSDTQTSLSWTDNATDEAAYKIERMTDTVTWTQIATLGANATSYVDSALTEGTPYYYRVTATKGLFASLRSNMIHATTLPTAPGALTVTPINGGQVALTWEDSSSVESGYSVEQLIDGTWQEIETTEPNAMSQTATGTYEPSTVYSFRVRAFATGYFSGYQYSLSSNVAELTTPAWPAAPGALTATPTSDTQIDLSWTDIATDETGYKIEWSPDGSNWSALVTVTADDTTYSDTGLSEGIERFYRVLAVNSIGDSAYSSTASATALPAAPANLQATIVDGSHMSMTWDDNSTIETGQSIEQWLDGDWQEVQWADADDTSFVVTGNFEPATQYKFRVKAYTETEYYDASSAPSNEATATTLDWPVAPTDLTTTVVSNTQSDLTWIDNATDETGYEVERTVNNVTWTLVDTLPADTTSYSDTGLTDGTMYGYRVQAINAVGGSGHAINAAATLPTAPADFEVTVVSGTQMDLSWTASEFATGYTISMLPEMSDTWEVIGTVPDTQTTYSATGLNPGGTYYAFTVAPTNSTAGSAVAYYDPATENDPPYIDLDSLSPGADPVTTTSTTLSVEAGDDQAESTLTYSWSTVSAPTDGGAYFSINDSNAAKNTTATFYAAGTYVFQVMVTDTAGATATGNVSVTVQQTLTGITISPEDAALAPGQNRLFTATAIDQFGNDMTTQPSFTWSVGSGGVGTISSTGSYTAPSSASSTTFAISASAGGKSGTASVAVKRNRRVVNFNEFPSATASRSSGNWVITGTEITDQYADDGVIFFTDPGKKNIVTWQCCGSDGNSIGTTPMNPDPQRWNNRMFLDFTMPVNRLTFSAVGDDNAGVIGAVQVHYGGGSTAIVGIQGNGNSSNVQPVDLSAYSSVSRIDLAITDPYGLWWDDFSFDEPTLLELTVGDYDYPSNSVTAIDAAVRELVVPEDESYVPYDSVTHTAKISIDALFDPFTNETGQNVHMTIKRNDGLLLFDDDSGGGHLVDQALSITNTAREFEIEAWMDEDGDGQHDAGEERERVVVKVVKPWKAQGTWTNSQASIVQAEANGASLQQLAWDITGNPADAAALGNVGKITKDKSIDVTPLLKILEQRVRNEVVAAARVTPRNAGFGGIGSNNALGIPAYEVHNMKEAEVNSIFDAASLTPKPLYHCWGMVAINFARGLIKGALFPGEFDDLGLRAGSFGQTGSDTIWLLGPLSRIPDGSLVSFDNHHLYGHYHPGGYWGDEYAVKTGNDRFIGWDIPNEQTEHQLKVHLRNAFNQGLHSWQKITIADVPGYGPDRLAKFIDIAKIAQRIFELRTGTTPP